LGVLPTRLSALDEAASIDVLCSDKTGTLTQNALTVTAVHAMSGFDESHVLGVAALASSDGGQDPVDGAMRAAAARKADSDLQTPQVCPVRSGDKNVGGDGHRFGRLDGSRREGGLRRGCRTDAAGYGSIQNGECP
jgi:magnesium-transporting ATPase (P-type)